MSEAITSLSANDASRRGARMKWMSVAVLIFGLSSGCSTFNHHWQAAAQASDPRSEMLGRWEGSWLSEANGHHGDLRCLITPLPEGRYRAWFRATYSRYLHFAYKITLNPTGARYKFEGTENLGWLAGGLYKYEGEMTPTNFFSTYRCKYDHGTFQMARPGNTEH